MSEEVYRRLAQRLDAIPNGFPATESGVELRLLARMFTPQEAELAAEMRLTFESASDIAVRASVDASVARRALKEMARKGLIEAGRGDRQLAFRLRPFVVGSYEAQLPRMDAELAGLFEQYFQEARGIMTQAGPSVHRVIPVREAIPFELEVYPYEQASELVGNAKSWGVRDCICRVQQKLIGKGCDRPIENCLSFAPVEGAYDHGGVTRPITVEDAFRILREAQEAGLVYTSGNYRDGNHYICTCCTCCCGVLRGVAEVGMPTAVARSDFYNVVDAELCIGCGDCVERCQFGALSVPDDLCTVDYARCVGCGLCVTVCPVEALHLERRPEGETPLPPVDLEDWMEQRAEERGISIADIL
jgi:ferredoxin